MPSILSSISLSVRSVLGVPSSDGVRHNGGTREGVGACAITGVVPVARVGVGVCAVLERVGVIICVFGGGVLANVGLCAGPWRARGWGAGGGVAADGVRACWLLFLGERKGGEVMGEGAAKEPTGAGEANGDGDVVIVGGDAAGCPFGPAGISSLLFSLTYSPSNDLILEIMKALSSVESGYIYRSFGN